MASKESEKLAELYRYWGERRAASNEGIPLIRDFYADYHQLATEAEGVSYATVTDGPVPGIWAIPAGAADGAAMLYLHGGAYLGGGSTGHRKLAAHVAKAAGLRTLVIDYRLAPEHRMPAQLEDSRAAFDWLVELGYAPERIVLAGDSAGGALATAVALHLRDTGAKQAGAVVAYSPYYDVETVGRTFDTNAAVDAMAGRHGREGIARNVSNFTTEKWNTSSPYINALRSDPTGLPPMLLSVGGAEVLADGVETFAKLAIDKGVEVELEVVPEMQHVFQFLAGSAPEADESIARTGRFMRERLGLS